MEKSDRAERTLDLLVVGAGPTGIAIGAEAKGRGLDTLLVERGPLVANLVDFPTQMVFFTTREKLEIAGVPFTLAHEKPTRREAMAYYRAVAAHHRLPLALHEEVLDVERAGERFRVRTRARRGAAVERVRSARAVALATGYFHHPRRLEVPGAELPWVHVRYREPDAHFTDRVVVVGGGNSAAEAALELWRCGARVTLVHRGPGLKETVKYWLKPDVENRIAAGEIAARFDSHVEAFEADGRVRVRGPEGRERLPADAAYVLIGYTPDADFERRCGVAVDPETLVPTVDAGSCESNVPGLYVAGTLQAGRNTGKIFIENSRDHGRRIVDHWLAGRQPERGAEP